MKSKFRTVSAALLALCAMTAFASDTAATATNAAAAATNAAGSAPDATGAARYVVTAHIDWFARVIRIQVTLDFRAAGLRMPSARHEGERMIERDLPVLAGPVVYGVIVDSRRDVGAAVADGSIASEAITQAIGTRKATGSRLSADMASLVGSYEVSLALIASPLVRHTAAFEPPPRVAHAPSKEYSGIIVYAKGSLPVHGNFAQARVEPCLFPRLFDQAMGLVYERNFVNPDALHTWGMVGYAEDMETALLDPRAGDHPLRIMAREVFGSTPTDIVIATDDAVRLLASAKNRELLKQGRVIVVIDVSEQTAAHE